MIFYGNCDLHEWEAGTKRYNDNICGLQKSISQLLTVPLTL